MYQFYLFHYSRSLGVIVLVSEQMCMNQFNKPKKRTGKLLRNSEYIKTQPEQNRNTHVYVVIRVLLAPKILCIIQQFQYRTREDDEMNKQKEEENVSVQHKNVFMIHTYSSLFIFNITFFPFYFIRREPM